MQPRIGPGGSGCLSHPVAAHRDRAQHLPRHTRARELLDVVVPGFCDLATVDLYQGLLAGDETP
ncbi:hypothetical protein, partial [Streptomyces nigra]